MYPISLKMQSFISHIDSFIDFTKFDAALIVGFSEGNPNVANGTGKSSIFDAILFSLYGKSRFNKKEKVVKRGESFCKLEFIFAVEEDIYKVNRIFNKKTGLIEVNFYKKQNNRWTLDGFTCDTATATTKKIEKVIGMNYDTFVNSIYFRQNDIAGFAGSKASKRKEILKEVLQIGAWDIFQETAKTKMKELQNDQEVMERRLDYIGDVEKNKEQTESEFNNVLNLINEKQKEVVKLEKQLKIYNDDLFDLKNTTVNTDKFKTHEYLERLKKIKDRQEEIKLIKNNLKQEVAANNNIIANAENDINQLEQQLLLEAKKITTIDHIKDDKILPKFQSLIKKVGTQQISLQDFTQTKIIKNEKQQQLNILMLELKQLTSLEPGEECPICLMENKNPQSVKKKREKKQIELQEKIVKLQNDVDALEKEIANYENSINSSKEAVLEISRLEFMIAKRMSESTNASEKNDEIRKKIKTFFDEWNDLKDEKTDVQNKLESLKDTSALQDNLNKKMLQISNTERKIVENRDNILQKSVDKGQLSSKIEEFDKQMIEKNILLERKEVLLDEIQVYSKLSKAFGRDGIQSIIMENVAEDLKTHANSFLKDICSEPMSIDFTTQRQTTTGSWKEDFEIVISTNNMFVDFDDLSGGEQVRVSIALRLAISRLLMQRVGSNIRFLLLDEVDQALDAHGIEVLANSIQALSEEFKIMIITHNDTMKENFEHLITVSKGQEGSVIHQ